MGPLGVCVQTVAVFMKLGPSWPVGASVRSVDFGVCVRGAGECAGAGDCAPRSLPKRDSDWQTRPAVAVERLRACVRVL